MGHTDSTQFKLHVLGAPDLRAPDGRRVASVLSQPKRLGLLTYLALAPAPVSRASLVALFWPESDEARARNALSQAVFYLRRSLAERVVESVEGDRLWAPPEHLWCDARERLAGDGSAPAPTGELLEGWNADDSQGLQEWLDTQRRRLRDLPAGATSTATLPDPLSPPAPPPAPPPAHPPAHPPPLAWPPAHGSPPPPEQPPASGAPSASAPAHPGRRIYAGPAGAAAFVVLAVTLLSVALAGDRGPGGESPAPQSLAVLMPQISAAPGAPDIDPGAVHAEILAHLPHLADIRIVSATYAGSLQDFRRQLAALGVEAPEVPGWILEVSIRVTSGEARAIGLLHRSPAFDLPGRVSVDVTYGGAEAALLEAPQEVARGVAGMVAEVLAEGRAAP
jgi:hypothetical protein